MRFTIVELEKMKAAIQEVAIKPKIINGKPYYTVHHKPWNP